ncbi:Crp/Fnr family transcriptional regulator, partial [bacterium]|nr:Crp/Fnr family transcriptional regulator [bacterium]
LDLSDESISEIAKITKVKEYAPKSVVFIEDDPADRFYILIDGRVDLIKSTPDGKEQLIRTVKNNEMFAEIVVFSGGRYPAMAIAKMQSKLICFDKKDFIKFIKGHPDVSLKMIGAMSKLLQHLNSLVGKLSLGSVASRLASFIVNRYNETGQTSFDIGMQKQELASELGTIKETLSRNLKKFQKENLIDLKKNQIIVKNINKLEGIASQLT